MILTFQIKSICTGDTSPVLTWYRIDTKIPSEKTPRRTGRAQISDSPVELGFEQRELSGDLDGVEGHQVEGVHLARPADVPLDGRGRALEGDAVADAVGLRLQLPLDDLVDGLHPLPHRLACGGKDGILGLATLHDWDGGGGVEPRCATLTSELDFAGDVLLELSPQLRVVLKVVEMMFDPLAENIEDPTRQRLVTSSSSKTNKQTNIFLM